MYINKIKILAFQLISVGKLFKLQDLLSFLRIRKLYSVKYTEFINNAKEIGLDFYPVGTYDWELWRRDIKNNFSKNLPIYFLHNHIISKTMVFGLRKYQKNKLLLIESCFQNEYVKTMLRESFIGFPIISNLKYLSSENTIHQAFHLSSYYNLTNKNFVDSQRIVEWGGGYGCLARMVKKINPKCTYIIMDLPELSVLQYVYLSSIFGQNEVNFITKNLEIEEGKINLISSDYFMSLDKEIKTDTFISNWALTESGKDYQNYVLGKKFFSAENILVSCVDDENNHIVNNESCSFDYKESITVLGGKNFYFMK
jgi:hypothetical protein